MSQSDPALRTEIGLPTSSASVGFPLKQVFRLFGVPHLPTGLRRKRQDACGFCQAGEGEALARLDYWNLHSADLVKCPSCHLIQMDPMLPDDQAGTGCVALYRAQQAGETRESRVRGYKRCFRKGVAFAAELKAMGFAPKRILEIGAGDGYFCRGIQFVFPDVEVVCVDIVEEVLVEIRKHHGFGTILGTPESLDPKPLGRFDLVIARDILEHVSHPLETLRFLSAVLREGGYFYFITPNGNQDIWSHYVRARLDGGASELLINHVNYFEPGALKRALQSLGLSPVRWYIHNFRGTKKGVGWKVTARLMAPPSTRRSAEETIRSTPTLNESLADISADEVVPKLRAGSPGHTLHVARARWQEHSWLKLNADWGVGHEIFCIAEKRG